MFVQVLFVRGGYFCYAVYFFGSPIWRVSFHVGNRLTSRTTSINARMVKGYLGQALLSAKNTSPTILQVPSRNFFIFTTRSRTSQASVRAFSAYPTFRKVGHSTREFLLLSPSLYKSSWSSPHSFSDLRDETVRRSSPSGPSSPQGYTDISPYIRTSIQSRSNAQSNILSTREWASIRTCQLPRILLRKSTISLFFLPP